MPHAYLPKRKSGKGGTFPDPSAVGVWDDRETHLGHLADSIEIPPNPQRIYSIPDPWARALLFDRALLDKDHKLRVMIVGEWRGLLALIGLRERRNFESLSVRPVGLSAGNPALFSGVLSQLLPRDQDMLSPESSWNQFHILRWQLRPYAHNRPRAFGFSSPMTLVATGADYAALMSQDEVPWFDGTRLTDPVDWLAVRERKALAEWVQSISHELTKHVTDSFRKGTIATLLNAFAKDLDVTAKAPDDVETILSKTPLGFNDGIFRVLNYPLAGETASISDVAIVTTKQNAPTYYLIDPSLAQQWQQSPNEIVIYGDVSLATSDRYTKSGAVQGQLPGGQLWCTPDSFFQSRLIYSREGGSDFPGCLPISMSGDAKKRSVVLPLSEEVLKLFTPKELQDSFSLTWLPNGGATCYLRLRLKTSSGQFRLCRVQKTYSDSEMVETKALPLVAIWPDFRMETLKWQSYFTFEMWTSRDSQELVVKPWSDDEREPNSSRSYNLDDRNFAVSFTKNYPEVLICSTPYTDRDINKQSDAKGLLLLDRPKPLSPPKVSRMTVGVDFGSTGSDIYQRLEYGDPTPVVFKNRLRQITGFDASKFKQFTRELFIPTQEWPADEILSVFQDFGDPKDGPNARVAVRDGHVLFADDPRTFISGNRNRVKSNLKWGDQAEKIAARDFLNQLCLQAAAEIADQGCTEVDIRYSFPTAFSDTDSENLNATWSWIGNKIATQTGLDVRLNPPYTDPVSGEEKEADHREAINATKFFCDYSNGERMDISGGAITVDIGGGTTDLAIWNRLELVSHSSVVFAGRDIFLAPLRRKPGILAEIDQRVRAPIDELLKGGQKDAAFAAQLDAIIAKHGSQLIEGLSLQTDEDKFQGLLSILETGLCGIGFYAGLLARRVLDGKVFNPGKRIAIFAGGNGSKIFRWCALGKLSERSEIHKRFANSFLSAADLKNTRIDIRLSEKPKSEVAYGLVCQDLPLKVNENFAEPMAGESFMIGGTEKSWAESPPAEEIRKTNVTVNRQFPNFQRFLEAIEETPDEDLLNRLGGEVDLRLTRLASEVAAAQQRERKKKKGERMLRNEPIFIIALKAYLAMRVDEWARNA